MTMAKEKGRGKGNPRIGEGILGEEGNHQEVHDVG